MSDVIEIKDLFFVREEKTVLNNINWTIHSGEHWALLGLNGSGKTTLLNMITGYIWPTKGQVSVLGHLYGTVDLREKRKEIGWVSTSFQERIHPNETALNLVISGLHASVGLYESPTEEQIIKAIAQMDKLNCPHLVKRKYHTCSFVG
ncbi:ABC-type molybdenum transport system ATPase subunit/photorepair protein PhrA [Fontibacillus solani]|uniref:ABC-type molybdenum transport system ATPase subunit/photorepair protein PhrA n=1 Tax=Fontibacillus solani TaxID=1572857 RepID=A0A7W3SVV7_9BACL|nr:ATP-binding cassette domain-containing protein [Fontibacillus solani]MBA9087147.1 ABC-type molybdenum transport system ATPase subunit/photorepair protein PhrA [Fontibacillus solani]